jgi:hypothetical protein
MNIFSRIISWNASRNNFNFNKKNEYDMLAEELKEFTEAISVEEEVDALCDIIVVAVGALNKLGYQPEFAMDETLKEIESRMQDPDQAEQWDLIGHVPLGAKWQKWREQPKDTLYTADYTLCKYNELQGQKLLKEELRYDLLNYEYGVL